MEQQRLDPRQFLLFLLLAIGVMIVSERLFPRRPPPQPGQQAGAAADAPGEAAVAPGVDAGLADDGAPDDDQQQAATIDAPPKEVKDVALERVALGSLDPDRGYRMLVTLTNRGAGVERAELTSGRFRDRHDRSGYLGHLALKEVDGGVAVGIVGPGTPAAIADIKVGDVITGIEVEPGKLVELHSVDALEAVRRKTKPGSEITLHVARGGGAAEPVRVKLRRRPLEVMRPELENIRLRKGTVPEGFVDAPSFLLSLASYGGRDFPADAAAQLGAWLNEGHDMEDPKSKELSRAVELVKWLEEGNWEITHRDAASVAFERPVPQYQLRIVKRYSLASVPPASRENENFPGYHLDLDVEVHNDGAAPQASVAYRLDGPTGLPIEGWWYTHKISQYWTGGAGLRDVVVRYQGHAAEQIGCASIADDKDKPKPRAPLAYVGVDAVYFSSILIPEKQSLDEIWFDSTDAVRVGPKLADQTPQTYTNVTCRLNRDPLTIAPGEHHRESFRVFIGPKRPELLSQYQAADDPHYSLRDIIYYGMVPFGNVARFMLGVLHFFYSIVGNYGIAIIMLTVVVRGAMFPISFKQTKNMARMQELKPEMDRITEKYKADLQKRSQAINELYRKHKINPLGGCLPLFLQLPVFIGLYRAIMIDVELRQRPLFTDAFRWCSDLSAPDMLFDWSAVMPDFINNGIGFFSLGPYFNVLPLVTIVMFLISMKMTMPPPTNEQTALQQKMMKYMTLFMGLIFYKVASGLCLYFIASSLWGIGERKLLGKTGATGGPADGKSPGAMPARDASTKSTGGRNGTPGKQKRSKAKRKR